MTDFSKKTLKTGWLIAVAYLLLAPIIYPSYSGSFTSPIRTSMLWMFLLSFPSSLIAMPIAFLSSLGLGFEPGSIVTNYLTLLLLALSGFLQWFWIMPMLFHGGSELQRLDLRDAVGNRRLFQPKPETYSDWFDTAGASPLEHAMREDDRHQP